jgi:hypothetical protein
MCSKCYKAESQKKAEAPPASPKAAVVVPPVVPEEEEATVTAVAEVAVPELPDVPAAAAAAPQANPGRCYSCQKKVGLLGFACRCTFTFCSSHRYADAHACPFDYKGAAATLLTKANPLVAGSKITKVQEL